MRHDQCPVADKDADEGADALGRIVRFGFPACQHDLRSLEATGDHRIQDLVLGAEVIVEIATRDADGRRDVGKAGRRVTLPVEQIVCRGGDGLARFRAPIGIRCRAHA